MSRYIQFKPAILMAIALLSVFWITPAQAKIQGGGAWSKPYRLSSEDGKASEGYLVADQYGLVHCFWIETLFSGLGNVIKYARFDGTTWTKPNDIYFSSAGIRNVSPFVDHQGILHIAWSEGLIGVPYYTYAPATDALSAQSWAKPLRINVTARPVFMQVDSKGVIHILAINQTEEESGIYHIRSENNGLTWSEPLWVDPDILPGHIPDSLTFTIDENDNLHAAWVYGSRQLGERTDWVRYAHSLDGGQTWSAPFLIDRYNEESDHRLDFAGPNMAVQGKNVHIIWAAGSLPYRYHRYSSDSGRTWSAPVQIFGELHGQAFDGIAVDRSGRVHFIGQIRYPMAIYHAYWDQNRWSKPSLVYFIAEESLGAHSDRVHAHHTLPVVRAGNQLVLTFADGPADPNRRLFVTHLTMDDISPLESAPTPIPTATPIQTSTPTPVQPTPRPSPTTEPALLLQTSEVQPVGPVPGPDLAVRVALVPTLLIIGVAMIVQLLKRRRQD